MARKTFFSFHYERDAWRAANVRNSGALSTDDETGFIDAADWEKLEREGDAAIKKWIKGQLNNTTVTAVLIGAETADRDWVLYEIRESWERGNAIIGVRIHGIKNQDGETDTAGPNPLDTILFDDGTSMSSLCKTYDWVSDEGREHLGEWLEDAVTSREDIDDKALKKEAEKSSGRVSVAAAPSLIRNPPKPWSA
ncbi:MAG TPA: TIR domain-containing protein [Rhizomicrobium sp.]|jgi:hypothetical protein|nr:TIR domain-containing protein [Rhizomicrobium sp.]